MKVLVFKAVLTVVLELAAILLDKMGLLVQHMAPVVAQDVQIIMVR